MQTEINIFIDENLPAETPEQRAKALRELFRIIALDNESGQIQQMRNLKLAQLLQDSSKDILAKPQHA